LRRQWYYSYKYKNGDLKMSELSKSKYVLYTKPDDTFCYLAETILKNRQFEHVLINVNEDPAAVEYLDGLGVTGVPHCFRDGVLISGGYDGMADQLLDKSFDIDFQLFYKNQSQTDVEVENFLSASGESWKPFYIEEHVAEYAHDETPAMSCFCRTPDYNDDRWPKLYNSNHLIAAGIDEILAVDFTKIQKVKQK
jgi:glutaredoxin